MRGNTIFNRYLLARNGKAKISGAQIGNGQTVAASNPDGYPNHRKTEMTVDFRILHLCVAH